MIWRIFIIVALLAAAGATLLARREHPEQLLQTEEAPAPEPGYFMTDARIVQTGPDGAPLYRMNAERIQQNPDDLTIRLQNLRLDYYPTENRPTENRPTENRPTENRPAERQPAGKRPAGNSSDSRRDGTQAEGTSAAAAQQANHWTLTARTGLMPQDATQVELRDDVEIKGEPQLSAHAPAPATLRTAKLSVDLQTQVARTQERVEILWGDRRLTAVGLTADLKAGRVKLESAVHGLFTR